MFFCFTIFRLYRAIGNIFDVRRKEITKWLKVCEKKEKEIPNDVQDLDEALIAVNKIKVSLALFVFVSS